MQKKIKSIACVLSLLAAPALADGEFPTLVTKADAVKLERFEKTKERALAAASRSAAPAEYKAIRTTLARKPIPIGTIDLTGNWQCRTTKLGGNPSLIRYGWFKCRVTDDGAGWQLTKLTGSQRTTGRFYTASDTAMHYLGTFYVAGEKAPAYGSKNAANMVGIASITSANSWRLEIPKPPFESQFDVMELRR